MKFHARVRMARVSKGKSYPSIKLSLEYVTLVNNQISQIAFFIKKMLNNEAILAVQD